MLASVSNVFVEPVIISAREIAVKSSVIHPDCVPGESCKLSQCRFRAQADNIGKQFPVSIYGLLSTWPAANLRVTATTISRRETLPASVLLGFEAAILARC